jgi:hypothetical protein
MERVHGLHALLKCSYLAAEEQDFIPRDLALCVNSHVTSGPDHLLQLQVRDAGRFLQLNAAKQILQPQTANFQCDVIQTVVS